MNRYRTIYAVEAVTEDGQLRVRRFARNRRAAEKIAKQLKPQHRYVHINYIPRDCRYLINPEWVEG